MRTIKYSRQREAIKEFLASRKDHPTADIIYDNIKIIYPNISLGTIYRNLSLLENLGEIQKISSGDSSDHYDYDTSNHYHFICKCCGRIDDLPAMDDLGFINSLAAKDFSGEIDEHKIFFYGRCKDCMNKDTNK